MANARRAALRDRRKTTKRKVLRPGSLSSAADSIARKMADAQFESMVKRYSDGFVSNEEMYSYLQSATSNPYFTEMDKVNIEDKLRDFEVVVNGERLETDYKAAEGVEKIKAAKALATYYNERATNLEEGTPAHSRALQAVADWNGKAEKVYGDIKKEERKFSRANAEYELSLLPPGVDSLQKQAAAYMKLAEEAQRDGETIDALEWASKSNEIRTTKLPAATKKEARDKIDERLDLVKSNYERGYISADDAVIELNGIDQSAQEAGLYDMLPTIDQFTEKLGLDVQKGTTIEEFEGRTFRVRKADGSELATTIKDMKAQFQEEDDRFRAMLYDSGKDQSVVEQYKDYIYIYALYLNGGGDEKTGTFEGLKNRRDLYSSWAQQAPEKAYTYEEAARNTDAQVTSKTDQLAQYVRTLDAYAGDTDEEINKLIADVTVLYQKEPIDLQGKQATGLLITKDKNGNQVQKFVPLNTQVEIVDDAGNTTLINTKVGESIGKVPGRNNIYVQLTPFYLEGEVPGRFNTYSYAEFEGEIYVQAKYDLEGELVKAFDLAKTNTDISNWFNSPDQRTGQSWKDYEVQEKQNYFNSLSPEEQQKKQAEAAAAALLGDQQELPPQDLKPKETLYPSYETRPDGKLVPSSEPGKPVDFSGFENIKFDQPSIQPTFTPAYAPTTNYTPAPINFGTQLTSPEYKPNALQSSGFKMELPKDEWKPPESKMFTGPTLRDVYTKVKDTVKSGVSSVGNWLKKINTFK